MSGNCLVCHVPRSSSADELPAGPSSASGCWRRWPASPTLPTSPSSTSMSLWASGAPELSCAACTLQKSGTSCTTCRQADERLSILQDQPAAALGVRQDSFVWQPLPLPATAWRAPGWSNMLLHRSIVSCLPTSPLCLSGQLWRAGRGLPCAYVTWPAASSWLAAVSVSDPLPWPYCYCCTDHGGPGRGSAVV